MNLVLDAGALVAIDRRDRTIETLLLIAAQEQIAVCTSGAVVAQVWRDGARQANLSRILSGVEVRALDKAAGKQVGQLLAASRASDVVDGHVAMLAQAGGRILTSDPRDITHLLRAREVDASVIRV